jgi:hypothetical protein
MPDNNGKLTAEGKDRASQWINERWKGNRVCSICERKLGIG